MNSVFISILESVKCFNSKEEAQLSKTMKKTNDLLDKNVKIVLVNGSRKRACQNHLALDYFI